MCYLTLLTAALLELASGANVERLIIFALRSTAVTACSKGAGARVDRGVEDIPEIADRVARHCRW